jgi:hypothetical protein
VGPSGSGTAQVAEEIFASRGFSALGIKVSHQPISEQLDMLKRGDLDLGVFVIHPDSDFIGRAIHEYGMQIAHFPEAEALAYWTPSLRAGVLNAGRYDPVAMVPSTDKTVLEVDTLVLANGCPGRSDVVGLLILLNDAFPGLIEHNLAAVKTSDHSLHEAASEFYQNNGPTLMDDHVPWLADYVPGSGLVQISLIISVLFNFMGLGNRFRLWRIDARRIALEQRISNLFTGGVRFADLAHIEPAEDQKTPEVRAEIEALIQAFEDLAATSNAQSQETILGPDMGQEIGYRFQESMMEERVHALREYLKKL